MTDTGSGLFKFRRIQQSLDRFTSPGQIVLHLPWEHFDFSESVGFQHRFKLVSFDYFSKDPLRVRTNPVCNQKPAPRPDHPVEFIQGLRGMRCEFKHLQADHKIESVLGEGKGDCPRSHPMGAVFVREAASDQGHLFGGFETDNGVIEILYLVRAPSESTCPGTHIEDPGILQGSNHGGDRFTEVFSLPQRVELLDAIKAWRSKVVQKDDKSPSKMCALTYPDLPDQKKDDDE